jgi:hypothetical protein
MKTKQIGRACLTALALLALFTPAARADFEESFTFDSEELRISNLVGEVRVEGHDGSDFEVVVNVQGSDAERDLIEFDVEEGRHATLAIIFPVDEEEDYVYPRWGHNSRSQFRLRRGDDDGWLSQLFGRGKVEIRGEGNRGLEVFADLTVRVPAGASLEVYHGAGEMFANSVEADLVLDSHVGAIEIEEVRGDVVGDTGSGSIEARDITGNFTADTGSGSVRVTDVEGERILADTGSGSIRMTNVRADRISADTGSGGVEVDGAVTDALVIDTGSGSVEALDISAHDVEIDTGSGSVSLDLVEVGGGEFVVDTGSGSIKVTVPPDFSARVVAETASGGIHVDVDDIRIHHKERDEIEFTAGAGDAEFELDAGSGSIRIATR